ncbi:MAG: hypothetical protein K8R54_06175 [Bacteroidales bacterium]|nr:hypothetical protein [Bacteroidales bacterium]
MTKINRNRIIILTLFAVAMAFLETTVVVYLRKLYYPEGFDFPLKMMEFSIGQVEFFRELATLVMILTVAMLTGKTKNQKFAAFIFIFAVWDIFYYVFLKVTLGWPVSLMTWDILFLIPVTWVGPVIAPVINSLMMIVLAGGILYAEKVGLKKILLKRDWWLLIIGSVVVIIAYIEDFVNFLLNDYTFGELLKVIYSEEVIEKSLSYIPVDFAWFIFIVGISLHAFAIANVYLRTFKKSNN